MGVTRKLIFLFLAVLIGCADKATEEKQEVSLEQLSEDEKIAVKSVAEDVLGEMALLFDTELNPVVVETSLNEVILARAPALGERRREDLDTDVSGFIEALDRGTEIKLDYYQLLTGYISYEEILRLRETEDYLRIGGEAIRRYSSALLELIERAKDCFLERKISLVSWEELNLNTGLCEKCYLVFDGCQVKDYSVSGTVQVDMNLSSGVFSFSFSDLTFAKENYKEKYFKFSRGNLSGKLNIIERSISIQASDLVIEDTEENMMMEGSLRDEIYLDGSSIVSKVYFDDLTLTIGETKVNLKGEVVINDIRGRDVFVSCSLDLSEQSKDDKSIGDVDLKYTHSKGKTEDPKGIFREDELIVSSTSPSTFSIHGYRYKKIEHMKTPDGKTFSFSITSYLKVNGYLVRSYVHDLTVVKEHGSVVVSGSVEVVKDDEKIEIELDRVVLERGCIGRPAGGDISARIRSGSETWRVRAAFRRGCVCGADVDVEAKGRSVRFEGDVCESGHKAKKNMGEEFRRRTRGDGGGGDHVVEDGRGGNGEDIHAKGAMKRERARKGRG